MSNNKIRCKILHNLQAFDIFSRTVFVYIIGSEPLAEESCDPFRLNNARLMGIAMQVSED